MRDIGLQQLQKSFVKSCYPIINLANTAVLAKRTGSEQMATEDIYRSLIDAVTLLGNALYDFSMKRRELLKTEVAVGYKSLCRDNQPVSSLLFGDELPQSIRDISQVKRMSLRKVSTQRKFVGENNSSRKFFRPYQTSRSSEPLNFTRRSDPRRPWSWANRRTNQQHQGRAGPQATSRFSVAQ